MIDHEKYTIADYIILDSTSISDLQEKVNEYIKQGYIPQGGVASGGESWLPRLQAMVKLSPKQV